MANDQPGRDPRLAALDILVGTWTAHIDHPALPDIPDGTVTFSWALDGKYPMQRSIIPQPYFPDSESLIAPGDEAGTYTRHYFDTRGVSRLLHMRLAEGVWTLRRTDPDFSPLDFWQRFEGHFSEDGDRIEGRWEQSHDGGATWELDVPVTYTRGVGEYGRHRADPAGPGDGVRRLHAVALSGRRQAGPPGRGHPRRYCGGSICMTVSPRLSLWSVWPSASSAWSQTS